MSIDRSIVAKLDDVLATIAFIWDHFSIMDAVNSVNRVLGVEDHLGAI